jgi:hypothetical protein
MAWTVTTTSKARKQFGLLPEAVKAKYAALAKELELQGPFRANWRYFGKLAGSKNLFHCHLMSGRPTYVACWEVLDKRIHLVEVYYVGTHENAPY